MKTIYKPVSELKTINWASGTSTELFIYPASGDFQTRDFSFRISTATVDADETVFSSFPNITRTLMVLEGHLLLIHEGRYTKALNPFEQDTFSGDWDTKSKGRVKDFNLMCKGNFSGSLDHAAFSFGETKNIALTGDFNFIYIASGEYACEGTRLDQGDTLQIEREGSEEIQLECIEGGEVVIVSINLTN